MPTNPTFAPPQNPAFPAAQPQTWTHLARGTEKGYGKVFPRSVVPPQSVPLVWPVAPFSVIEYVVSFFHAINGPAGTFKWAPINKTYSPALAPDLDSVAGGSLGADTYYAGYTWYDATASQETLVSGESSLAVSANNLLTVTVPPFPSGVGAWRVYVGTVSGDLDLQASETTRTWTMPTGGVIAGAAPPSSNTLNPQLTWRLSSAIQPVKIAAARYSLRITIQEVFA